VTAVAFGLARPAPPPRVEKLLLATDLSEASTAATEQAFLLASRLGASLLVVSVIDPGSLLMPGGRYNARMDQVRERREVGEAGRRAGLIVEPSVDALAKMKSFLLDVREGEMGHVEIGENDGGNFIVFVLPIANPEAKKSDLIAVVLAAFSLQVTRVVPPLRSEIGVRVVIGGKG